MHIILFFKKEYEEYIPFPAQKNRIRFFEKEAMPSAADHPPPANAWIWAVSPQRCPADAHHTGW